MAKLSDSERHAILTELLELVETELSSFTVTDGVLKVRVASQDAAERLPSEVRGYPTEVSIRPRETPLQCFHGTTDVTVSDRQENEYNPVPIGVRFGGCTTTGYATDGNEYYALTASHCALSQLEPTTYFDQINHMSLPLGRNFQGNIYGDGDTNYDFAFAELASPANTELLGFDEGVGPVVHPDPGEQLTKIGVTSGVTTGQIEEVDVTYLVQMGSDNEDVVYFAGGIETASISESGDSGGLAFVERDGINHPVGIVSAGSSELSHFCELQKPMQDYGLSFVTGRKKIEVDGTVQLCGSVPASEAVIDGQNSFTIGPS